MENINKQQRKAKKGFTLVELLIVIIIIGILAGMMMLSTGSAKDKAEATKIVSNMRTIKSAALMYYADNGKWPAVTSALDDVSKYLDSSPDAGVYSIKEGAASGDLSVEAIVSDSGVRTKLGGMAEDSGLYKDAAATGPYTSGDAAYMIIKKH